MPLLGYDITGAWIQREGGAKGINFISRNKGDT